MPAQERVRDVLADLMGRTVTVARTATVPVEIDGPGPVALADYAADGGELGVLCVADLRLTNALGAALTMVAPAAVDEAVERLRIDDPTIDNFREVVSILTSLFNTANTPHVKFREVHRLPTELPADTMQLLGAPRGRRDFDVSVEDYGTGRLSLFIA
jgi:hypothetical protein